MASLGPNPGDIERDGEASPIVVFGYPAIGDLVRCHSLVRILAQRFPHRPLDVVTRHPTAELVQFMPEVREAVAENFRHRRLDLAGRFALAKTVRQRGYHTAYVIPSSFKAALVPFLARIPERIGWVPEGQVGLINRPRFGMHRIPRMMDRLCLLGLDRHDGSVVPWPAPRLRVPATLRDRFEPLLREVRSTGPVVTLALGSSNPRKNWAIENYVKVAQHCIRRGCSVWAVGSGAEGKLAREIGQHVRVQDRTKDSVENLALTIAASDVFVGNDSGPMHLAASFDMPCVEIFGISVDDPGMAAPINIAPFNAPVQFPLPERRIPRRSRNEVHWPSPEQIIACIDRALEAAPGRDAATAYADDEAAGGSRVKAG